MRRVNYNHTRCRFMRSNGIGVISILAILAVIVVASVVGAEIINPTIAPPGTVELTGPNNGIRSWTVGGGGQCIVNTSIETWTFSTATVLAKEFRCGLKGGQESFLKGTSNDVFVNESNETFDLSFKVVTFQNPGAITLTLNSSSPAPYSRSGGLGPGGNYTQIMPMSTARSNVPYYQVPDDPTYFVPAETNATAVFHIVLHNFPAGDYVAQFPIAWLGHPNDNTYAPVHLVVLP